MYSLVNFLQELLLNSLELLDFSILVHLSKIMGIKDKGVILNKRSTQEMVDKTKVFP